MAGTLIRKSQIGPWAPLDASNGVVNGAHRNAFYATLTANTAFDFQNVGDGCSFVLKVTQASPVVTITWPGSVVWPGGFAPFLSAGETGIYTFQRIGAEYFGSSAIPGTKVVFNEDLSGELDGSATEFELAEEPVAGFHMVFLNGVKLAPGAENAYTLSGKTLSLLVDAPLANELLQVTYLHNGTAVAAASGQSSANPFYISMVS